MYVWLYLWGPYKPYIQTKPKPKIWSRNRIILRSFKWGAAICRHFEGFPSSIHLVLRSIEEYEHTRGQSMTTHSLSVPLGMFLGMEWIPRPWQSTVFPRQLQGAGHASTPPRPATSTRTPHASIVRSPDQKARPGAAAIPQPPDPAPSPLLPAGILLSCSTLQKPANRCFLLLYLSFSLGWLTSTTSTTSVKML